MRGASTVRLLPDELGREMTKQTILWTVVPYGRVPQGEDMEGQLRVSAIVAPRLTPGTVDEQILKAFPDFLDWPDKLGQANFELQIGGTTFKLKPLGKPDSELWKKLFGKETPVAGFKFKDMSTVNLRSFPVRHMLGLVRKHYSQLAVQAASNHPMLLPWKSADPNLKDMLTELGTKTATHNFGDRSVEVALPGFQRFFDDEESQTEEHLSGQVFGEKSIYKMKVASIGAEDGALPSVAGQAMRRVLPPDWYDPRPSGPGTPLLAKPDATLMDQFSSEAEYSMYQANRFYRREPATAAQQKMRFPTYQNIPAAPAIPEYDFHRIVASFASYPLLLRALGLIVDFAVEDGDSSSVLVAGPGPSHGNMALKVNWSDGHDDSGDGYPRTAWELDKERFTTRPRENDVVRGLLRLEHSDDGWGQKDKEIDGLFDLYQVDPDGAALKTVGFTLTTQNLVAKSLDFTRPDGRVTYTTGDRQPLAALRSGGLGVSRHGRAEQVAADAAAAALKNQAIETGNSKNIVFFAEDLHRGYRVDVAPVDDEVNAGRWHPLCARLGQYHLIRTDEDIKLGVDEGHVSGPSATSSDTANTDDYYMHESLFRWTGWSLSAPRPGKAIRATKVEGTELQGEAPADITDQAENGNGIAARFKVPKGSLPKLRFGQLYRLRARFVDVAGNSLSSDDPTLGDLEQASDAVGYWRFEPIDPPAIIGRGRLSEGESLERMVIRSNYNAGPADYLQTPDFALAIADPESQDFDYTALNERHVVPPKASQQQCETHGLFDAFFGQWGDIKKGYEIAAREDGTLFDDMPGSLVELITPKSLENVAKTTSLPPEMPVADNPVGDRLSGGQYTIHREAQLVVPYLPDGAGAGVALRAMPGEKIPGVTSEGPIGPGSGCVVVRAPNDELVLLVAHAKEWPDSLGFRIILAERKAILTEIPCNEAFDDDGQPIWDDKQRTLTLFLSKGRIARLRYSSFAHSDFIESFGIIDWAAKGPDRAFVHDMALLGCHWMLTPFRKLTLVHATQQPICLPEMIKMSISRPEDAQYADIRSRQIQLHGPSTGKFEILAEWHEWIDDLNRPRPERVRRKGQLGEVQLPENHPNIVHLAAAIAAQNVDPARPRAPANRHELGDTKFRLIQYKIQATTRFREYLPPSIYAQPDLVTRIGPVTQGPKVIVGADDDAGAPVLRDPAGSADQSIVPASAPPDDPRVLYVVPTFRWQSKKLVGGRDITRFGNGLRVWLDRPWFSSGDGELLGVVLHQEGGLFTKIPDRMQALVTQWGLDPMWDTTHPKKRTRATDFPARVHSKNVLLQESSDKWLVEVVGHRVHWDDQRGLWYCDIELNTGATYMPFVRLALVRYQPNAIPGQEVSKVVTAEFSQVLPRRRAVYRVKDGKISLRVHGHVPTGGPMKYKVDSPHLSVSFSKDPKDTGRNRFELVLQTRDAAIDSDLAWHDHKVLDTAVIGGSSGGFTVTPGLSPGGIFAGSAEPAPIDRVVDTRAGRSVRLSAAMRRNLGAVGSVTNLLDPAIWNISVKLGSTGNKPTRLMLREFERYYTDRTAAEKRGNTTYQRRYVEERLVYASILELPKQKP